MSMGAVAAVFKHSRAERSARLVMIGLADKHHGLDGPASCSLESLSAFARLPVEEVRQTFPALILLGELRVFHLDYERLDYDLDVTPLCSLGPGVPE